MEVPQEILEKWRILKGHGDLERIVARMSDESRVSTETIRRVFRDGRCNDEVFKAMAAFYEERQLIIAKYV